MKKLLLFILSATLLFTVLCSCATQNSSSESSSSLPVETTSESLTTSPNEESSSPIVSEETSEETSEEPDGPVFVIEGGADLATSAPFLSRTPENYGTHNEISLQSVVVSQNSTVALKGVFNQKGAYPYNSYQVWTWLSLRLQEHYKQPVDLNGKTLTYDVKTENCGTSSSFIIVAPNGQRTSEATFSLTDPSKTSKGITCTSLSNGWNRVSVDFSKAFGAHPILKDAAELFIMFTNEDCENSAQDSIFYIDNMSLTDTPVIEDSSVPETSEESSVPETSEESSIPETSEESSVPETSEESSAPETSEEPSAPETSEEEPPVVEYGDLATSLTIRSKAPNYGAVATLSYDTEIVSMDSIASLKGVFNATGADAYQGYKVWTWAELCLEEDFGSPFDLSDLVLTYDVRMENCGIYSSFILVAPDGSHSKELTFDFNHPSSGSVGVVSQPLNNGWYRITLRCYGAFADNPSVLKEVSSILIMFSNQASGNATFYLDNMSLSDSYNGDLDLSLDGNDLATQIPFKSQAPGYGAITTFSYDTKVVSYEYSYASLKGVFSPKGANTYQGYMVWTWAELCLEEYYGEPVNLQDTTLCYYVKPENCGIYSSFILVAPDGSRSQEITFAFNDPSQTYPGIVCTELSDGWYQVEVEFSTAYASTPQKLTEVSSLLIMFTNQDCADHDADSVYYIDDMHFYFPEYPDDEYPDDEYPDDDIPFEYDDYVTYLPVQSGGPIYGAISTLSYDTEVVATSDSLVSLKGEFNSEDANTYQGYIVWTWVEFCLAEYAEESVDLNDMLLTYDVKTINCGIYSSFILVSSDGTYSKEVTFAFEDPTQTSAGITSTPWGNGWCTVEIDFSVAFADDPSVLDDVASILIVFSNQDCEDRNANSVYYIDNMLFEYTFEGEDPDDDELDGFYFPEELDLATSDYVASTTLTTQDVASTLTVQEEVTSSLLFDSEAALKGTFYSSSYTTTWLVFDVEAFYTQPVPLGNSILYFEIMTENCDMLSSLVLQSTDGKRSIEMSFLRDDYEMLNENVLCIDWENGWTGILINIAGAFESDATTIQEVSKLFLSFNNKGYEGETSVFYIDNFLFTYLPDEEELEDFATNCTFVSKAPENYGAHNTLTVQSEVISENSSAALQGVFNNMGAQTHNGYAVWTWASMCLEETFGTAVPCNDLYLVYDVKVENCGQRSSFILVGPDGSRSQEITFSFVNPLECYPGVTCTELSDGWYRVTLDFNVAFASEHYVLDEVSEILIMFTNENCQNPNVDSYFYIDNMIFTDGLDEE